MTVEEVYYRSLKRDEHQIPVLQQTGLGPQALTSPATTSLVSGASHVRGSSFWEEERMKRRSKGEFEDEDDDEGEDDEWGGYHRPDPRVHLLPYHTH